MEKDDEVKGSGNSLDFGARIYDSRLGRWLSIDPAFKKYPYLSSYIGFENNPTSIIDPGGDTTLYYSNTGKYLGKSLDNLPAAITIISEEDIKLFTAEYNYFKVKGAQDWDVSNDRWRSYGQTFDVNSMRQFYDDNTIVGVDNIIDKTGLQYADGYFNEKGSLLYEKNGIVKAGKRTSTLHSLSVTDYPSSIEESDFTIGKIHTHPNSDLPDGKGRTFNDKPSEHDIMTTGKNETNVVVDRKSIHIYSGKHDRISVDKNKLEPIND
jgi:RHS repeat-associated protein